MLKQKLNKLKTFSKSARLIGLAVVMAISMTGGIVRADRFDSQIQQLEGQNALKEASLSNLQLQATSYQDAINKLQEKINQLEAVIVNTESQQAIVKQKIADAQKQLDHQKRVLGEAIKTMYLEGQTSTLEVLLSSNSLGDFVNQEQYHLTVQQNIKASVDKIAALKAQLKAQNDRLTLLLKNQKAQQDAIAAARDKQNSLLGFNQSQQANFNNQISQNNSQIASLRAQQAAAYAAYIHRGGIYSYGAGSANDGGYPSAWANAPQDTIADSWGMLNRECVSYVAWKVDYTHHDMPYWGNQNANAYNWINLAQASGISTGTTPRHGSVVVWEHDDGMGWLGHVAYVETVNSDGSIEVSQYNVIHGEFSYMHVDSGTASSLHYIYF